MRFLMLARQDILEGIRSGMRARPDSNEILWLVGGGILLVVVLIAARRFFAKEQVPKLKARRDHLVEAANGAGLLQSEQSDLRMIASRARIAHPASLLLSPENLAHAVREGLGPHPDHNTIERVQRLAQRLFEQELQDIGPQPGEYV